MRLATTGLIFCLLLVIFSCSEEKTQAPPPPPADVSVIETQAESVPLFKEFLGEVKGFKDIAIRARVEGFLEGLHFREGAVVQENDLLYTLESDPFEEKVAERMSRVAEVETRLAKAKGDLDRIRPLAEMNAVSKSELDAAEAAYEATLSSLEGAKASLRAAEIEMGYTKIHSPITGVIGKSMAKVGDFVGRDPSPVILTTVSEIDSVLVTFHITERQYLILARKFTEEGKASSEADLQLVLVDGSLYEHKGKVDFVDREVDTTTGSMLVQSSFPNPDNLLRPGQFTKVRIKVQTIEDGITIPQRCVMEVQGLYNVFVVGADNIVETREIKVGPKIGSQWLITDGLESGEQVIYEGLQRARDGGAVAPKRVENQTINPDKT